MSTVTEVQKQLQAEFEETDRIISTSLSKEEGDHVKSSIEYLKTVLELAKGNSVSFRERYHNARELINEQIKIIFNFENKQTVLEATIEGQEKRITRLEEENRYLKNQVEMKQIALSGERASSYLSETERWRGKYDNLHSIYATLLLKFKEIRRFRPDNFSIDELEKALERKRRIEKKEAYVSNPDWEQMGDGQNLRIGNQKTKIERNGEKVTIESPSGLFQATFFFPKNIRIFKMRRDTEDGA